jgi:hypothetical protein
MEAGLHRPHFHTIEKVAEALDVDPDELIEWHKVSDTDKDKTSEDIVAIFDMLDSEENDELLGSERERFIGDLSALDYKELGVSLDDARRFLVAVTELAHEIMVDDLVTTMALRDAQRRVEEATKRWREQGATHEGDR